jgi:hypothetical protein
MKVRTAAMALLLSSALLPWTGCQRVHYRFYDFEPVVMSEGQTSMQVVMSGAYASADSAGRHVERWGNPYRLGLYVTRPPDGIEVLSVRLTAMASGVEIVPALSRLRPLSGDTLRQLYAVTDEITLPHENHRVEVRVRLRSGATVRETVMTGILRKRFEQSERNRFWEGLMSV